ncbi:MAG: isoprenylcysteine carboxylmethyltransferase family protein [Thermodesulfobacteriota bacterium]
MSGEPAGGIHRLFNHPGVRGFLRKIRVPLAVAAAVLLLYKADPAWFVPALCVSLAGELVQLWCFGTLHKKAELAADGPYAVVRNPMYLGRFFLILGVLMLLGAPWILPVFTVIYYFYMANRVRREEATLREVFGKEYEAYCAEVPRFLPTVRPFRGNPVLTFRSDLFLRNHGHWNLLSVAVFYAIAWAAIRWR